VHGSSASRLLLSYPGIRLIANERDLLNKKLPGAARSGELHLDNPLTNLR